MKQIVEWHSRLQRCDEQTTELTEDMVNFLKNTRNEIGRLRERRAGQGWNRNGRCDLFGDSPQRPDMDCGMQSFHARRVQHFENQCVAAESMFQQVRGSGSMAPTEDININEENTAPDEEQNEGTEEDGKWFEWEFGC